MIRSICVLGALLLAATGCLMAQDGDPSLPPPVDGASRGAGNGIQVIYTNIPGDPSAAVPGLPGVEFDPGSGTAHFDRVYGSPNGHWALTALTNLATTEDEVLIVDGVLQVREGTAATWTAGENVGPIDTKVGVNDSGSFVFSTNTDGVTTADEYVVVGTSGGMLSSVAQEGGSADALIAGATWGSTLESAVILADETAGFVCDNLGGVPITEVEILALGASLLAQEGVSVPSGQVGTEFWENFDISGFWATPDGQHYLAQGDLTGDITTDDVVVLNGAVVIQEGSVLPGSDFPNPVDGNGIVGIHMSPGGRYFARGNNQTSELDWIYSDGAVIAMRGDPITVGTSELWDDTDFSDLFFLHVGNTQGDYVIGGVTSADSAANGVLVLNNQTVVVRESDPLDLDGNGAFDDDTFFDTFGNDDGFLADDRSFYFVATIKNGAGTRVGQGVFLVQLTIPTFTVGGSVSGLAGSGLVLQNNAGDDLTINANSAFTFATTLPDGSDYLVTVATQPADPSQTCLVSNGAGTLAGSDVTNVAIACSTNTFTVGGTVSGLAGTGLVLQNNDGDDLPINANGAFTFPIALVDGNGYAVTVATQPSVPAQACNVIGGIGTLSGSQVSDIEVTCVTLPFTLTAAAGDAQVAPIGTSFDVPLAVQLLDGNADPVAAASVIFTAPESGPSAVLDDGSAPSGSTLPVLTDVDGIAIAVATANSVPGCYTVLANHPGTVEAAEFTLTNFNPVPAIFANGFEAVPFGKQRAACPAP